MEPHRVNGLPQKDFKLHSPRNSLQGDSAGQFGVRVQVQGIKGHPYVVVNNGGKDACCPGSQEGWRDVSVAGLQSEKGLAVVRGSPLGSSSWDRRQAVKQGQYGSQGDYLERPRSPNVFHYQRFPELLRPYDPDNSHRVPSPSHMGHSNMIPKFRDTHAPLPKARIPLPAEGSVEAQSHIQNQAFTPGRAPMEQAEATRRSPNSLEPEPVPSVGRLIDQFDRPQKRGRCGRRGRIDSEDQRRSRSVDSSRPSNPSSPSAIRGETPGGSSVPGSPRARFFLGEVPTLAHQRGHSRSTMLLSRGHEEKEQPSPRAVQALYRGDKTSLSASTNTTDDSTEERDTQVTPDLLKGWQELLPQPNEETTKHILYTYLKDGTTDNDSTTQRKVNLVFDRISNLKWKTAERVEAENRDFAAEAKALQEKGEKLEREVLDLKKRLEDGTLNERSLAEACMKAKEEVKGLQEELETRQQELSQLRGRLSEMETELQTTKQELVQLKAEREKSRMEMKDLQQQLSEMHDELDQAKKSEADRVEDEVLLKDMAQLRSEFQEVLQVQEEQEEVLRWRERELTALKGALKEEVETHDKDMVSLREEYEKEFQQLRLAVDKVKESNSMLGQEKARMVAERGEAREQVMDLTQEREKMRDRVQDLEREVEKLNHMIQESRALENQLEDRANLLRREKEHVEETLMQVREKEEELCQANQALAVRLENIQSEFSQLNHENRAMEERLREERRQTEELRRRQSALEEERRAQDTCVEQLQKQMSDLVGECETSTDELQAQIDEARETSFRELAMLQKQLQEKGGELEKSRLQANKLQEELSTLEEDLRRCRKDRDTAQETSRQLGRRVEELEERGTAAQEEQAKQVKVLEVRISKLEDDLCEERSNADLLMTRVDKGKEQLEKMRSELQQERAARQDLECNKITLERQNKDLKGRVAYLESSQKSNQDGLVSKLVVRIQELEEKLQGEERDNSNLQQANRKLERKVKEMMIQMDDEHLSLQTQKDQLTQRLKTAKRQMDEAEEEIERLEHVKKKLQRDLDEQAESNETLQNELHALRCEMRRKAKSNPLMMIVEDQADNVDDCISD